MFRTSARAITTVALVLTGVVSIAAPAAAGPPSPTELATALDAPAGVTVVSPTDLQSYGVVTNVFNDLPSKGTSYVVLSTGKAADAFSSSVPDDQPSTDLGDAGPDETSLQLEVAPQTGPRCLLIDFAMATEERVHTYTASTPSDSLSVTLEGDNTERAINRGGAYIDQAGRPNDDVSYTVNGIDYWHAPGDESDPLHGTVEQPRLSASASPLDSFTTRDTAEVPLSSAGGTVHVTVADANNGRLDSVALIDDVRLAASCSRPAEGMTPDTGVAARVARIDGYRGVGNVLTLDPNGTTVDLIEKYDDVSNGWLPTQPTPVQLRFRWYRGKTGTTCYSTDLKDWTPIPDADRQSYVPSNLDKGKCLMVLETGVKDGFRTETYPTAGADWYVTLPIEDGTFDAEEPTVTGDLEVGEQLEVNIPTFTPRPDSHTIQWYAGATSTSAVAISGQTGPTLRLTAAEAGKLISVRVTARRSGFNSATKTSPMYGPVGLQQMESAGTPTIVGTMDAESQVSVDPGQWSPAPDVYTYKWKLDGTVVLNATNVNYTPKDSDVGKALSVEVRGAKSGYAPLTATSAPRVIGEASMVGATPTITGLAKVGERLRVSTTGWQPLGSLFTYEWFVGGQPVPNETASSLLVPRTANGKRVSVEVTGSRLGYSSLTRESAGSATVVAGDLITRTPTITGLVKRGYTLTARTYGWAPYGVTFTYRWKVNGKSISGATKSKYKISKSYKSKRITVTVTGSLTGYTSTTKTSARTTTVK